MALVAGIARVPLPTPIGDPMMGYGARTGTADRVHDPLHARALYLANRGACLVVELDVCLLAPGHAEAIRARIAERTGLARGQVLVGSIHTHSGPETGFVAWLGDREPPPVARELADAAVAVAAQAHASATPARLGVGRAEAHIGRNRRRLDGPLDPEVLVVRVDRSDGAPLAVLWVHGCHPTALGHDNLAYSADWPGAATRAIESALPGAAPLFALGAHADVDPRTRGLLDLAVEGQSVGVGFDAMEALGREVGAAVAAAAARIETDPDAPIAADTVSLSIPVHAADADGNARHDVLAREKDEALRALDLDPDAAEPSVAALFALVHERTRHLPRDQARARIAAARRYLRDRTAPRFAGGRLPSVGAQVLRLGAAWLVALPAEATTAVGLDWKARLGGAPGAVISIANGWYRYLPHAADFAEPGSDLQYEIVMSTFAPDAATRLLDAAAALRERLA
jgi:Neutral/alkaline non-lysosomal ceramidase, N-terminal